VRQRSEIPQGTKLRRDSENKSSTGGTWKVSKSKILKFQRSAQEGARDSIDLVQSRSGRIAVRIFKEGKIRCLKVELWRFDREDPWYFFTLRSIEVAQGLTL